MSQFRNSLSALVSDDSGQDLIEYALIAAIIALGTIAAQKSLTNTLAALENLLPSNIFS